MVKTNTDYRFTSSNLAILERELEYVKNTKAQLETKIQAERAKESSLISVLKERIGALPAQFNVGSVKEVVDLIKGYCTPSSKGRGRHSKLTNEVQSQILSLVRNGKTGKEIKAVTGLSLPTIQKAKSILMDGQGLSEAATPHFHGHRQRLRVVEQVGPVGIAHHPTHRRR